jgi:hypothetical protein
VQWRRSSQSTIPRRHELPIFIHIGERPFVMTNSMRKVTIGDVSLAAIDGYLVNIRVIYDLARVDATARQM